MFSNINLIKMATDILLRLDNNIPIAVMEKDYFLSQLPSCFNRQFDGTVIHEPASANVFTDKRKNVFLNGLFKTVKVTTWEEFNMFRQRLLTLPTFVMVTLERKRKLIKLKKRLRYVVYLNPMNPVIKAQLEEKLIECEREIKEDGKFCFAINLGPLIRSWYRAQSTKLFKRYHTTNSVIYLTNHKKCTSIFSNVSSWILLWPIFIFAAPIYYICRAARCNDIQSDIDGFVTFFGPYSQNN